MGVKEDVEILMKSLDGLPEPCWRPHLIVVSGLPGSGKSYFSRKLKERLPSVIIESDAMRKILFPNPTYSPEESARLFKALHMLVEELLAKGIPVIFDATNLIELHREYLYHLAEKLGAKLIIVWVKAPFEVIKERLERRKKRLDPEDKSDAGIEVYMRMRRQLEPIKRNHFVVDTSRDINPVIEKILREVRK